MKHLSMTNLGEPSLRTMDMTTRGAALKCRSSIIIYLQVGVP